MKFLYATAAAVLALATAPAALAQQSTNQAGPATSVFQPLQNGGLRHLNSGYDCPGTLASFKFQKHTIYNPNGSDVGCAYTDAATNKKMNLYIYKRPDTQTVNDLALGAARTIYQNMEGLELDKAASQDCQIGVGTAMMKAGHVKGDATAPPCYVFTRENLATLVSVWKRGDWNIKVRMSGPDTRITNATAAVYAMSYERGGPASSAPAILGTSNPPPAAPSKPAPAPAPQKGDGLSKTDVDQFCGEERTQTTPGMQFNGKKASTAVMSMAPGRYDYIDNGAMMYFANKSYLVRLPDTRKGIFGTDGDDMVAGGGLIIGCNGEQLSEIFERNELDINAFTLVKPY